MSNEYKSIHDFDFNLICEYFSYVERQGPGSPEITLKALSFVDNLTGKSRIADLGCGTGGQTMTLGQHTQAQIEGIDIFPAFIDKFNANAAKLNLSDRVRGIVGSMDNLPYAEGELDLIWCEGAIYNIGYERGLNEWRKYLRTGGYVAVSEATWFTDERPAEIEEFWMEAYPEIDTIARKVDQMQKAGYVPVATFIFPEKCWFEHYFEPKKEADKLFLEKYPYNQAAIDFIASEQHEEDLYNKYKSYFGYAFYIGKKF